MDDVDDLIAQLCTRAGMIMEDASPIALTLAILDAPRREQALTYLDSEICRMRSLVRAALALSCADVTGEIDQRLA